MVNLNIFNGGSNKVHIDNTAVDTSTPPVVTAAPDLSFLVPAAMLDIDALLGTDPPKSPTRRDRIKTMTGATPNAATTERMKRNTDSMLEDVTIAGNLKKRLAMRREQVTKMSLEVNASLSSFVLEQLTSVDDPKSTQKNSHNGLRRRSSTLDALAAVTVVPENCEQASELAMKAAMDGYFSNIPKEKMEEAKKIFMESLQREEYSEGNFLCRQKDPGDKLWVLEEGRVVFIVNGLEAGSATNGSVFGELSLIYGVPRQADVQAASHLICWSIDTLAFRLVQALIARDSLNTSKSKIMTKFGKQASALCEEQETAVKDTCSIPFEDLDMLSVVGQGTFGAVYIAAAKSDPHSSYALKRMSKASIVDRENETRVLIERNALQAVRGCQHIINLMGTYQDHDCIYFLTECVQGGNLISYMIDRNILSHSEACFYTYNIAMALVHIHSKGYIHRDIKPENCLIDKDGYIKLCDFGMAKRLPATVKLPTGGTEVVTLAFTMCGTPEFMAPEFVLSTGYDKAVDFWALGCIMVEMYCGRGPFDYDGDLKKTFKAVCLIGMGRKKLDLPKQLMKPGVMDTAGDFAKRILVGAKERMGIDDEGEVVGHSYFDMLNKEEILDRSFTAPYHPTVKGARDASNFKQDGETPVEDPIEPYDGDSAWSDGF